MRRGWIKLQQAPRTNITTNPRSSHRHKVISSPVCRWRVGVLRATCTMQSTGLRGCYSPVRAEPSHVWNTEDGEETASSDTHFEEHWFRKTMTAEPISLSHTWLSGHPKVLCGCGRGRDCHEQPQKSRALGLGECHRRSDVQWVVHGYSKTNGRGGVLLFKVPSSAAAPPSLSLP